MGTNYFRVPLHDEVEIKKEFIFFNIKKELNDSYLYACDSIIELVEEFRMKNYIHLGKKSYGYKFLFAQNDWKFYSNKEEIIQFIKSGRIIDEYEKEISHNEMIEICFNNKNTDIISRNYHDNFFISKEDLEFGKGYFR